MTAGSSSTLFPTRPLPRRRVFLGLALITLLSGPVLAGRVMAADFPEPRPYGGPPEEAYPERGSPPPLRFEERDRREPCRTTLRRHITRDGEEVERRVTVCDEGPVRPERDRFEPEPRPDYRERERPLPPRGVPDERFDRQGLDDGSPDEGPPENAPAPYERGSGPRY